MGNWATAIKSNDTYADVYADFFDMYDEGLAVNAITQKLIVNNRDTINDTEDGNNFWFALAKAQWECKQLDTEVLDRVKKIIQTGADLEVWRQLGADEKDITKRKVVLDKFLAEILSERPKAKERKKKILRQPVFAKGDCLTFKLANGNYAGAVVLESIADFYLGLNLIAVTRINQTQKPDINDFEKAKVLITYFHQREDNPFVGWFYQIAFKKATVFFEIIGKVTVEIQYKTDDNLRFTYFSSWDSIKNFCDEQFKRETSSGKPSKEMEIKDFILKKSKFKV